MKKNWAALYRRYSGWLFGVLALVISLCVLYLGDDIGLSNNGDFNRVRLASSLSYGAVVPNHTYAETYTIRLSGETLGQMLKSILFSREGLEVYPSVHVFFVRSAVALNLVWNSLLGHELARFSMSTLGTLYCLLYAAGIGMLCGQVRLKSIGLDVLLKTIVLIVLCDIGYVAYFNSLYGEALEHIALVWCAAALLRVCNRQTAGWDGALCALWAVVYGGAKFFNIPLAILFGAVSAGIVFFRRGKKPAALLPGLLSILVLLGIWSAVPAWMDTETNYNALFYGILRDVEEDTAREYLTDMGLPEELAAWRDTNYYLDGAVSSLAEQGLLDAADTVGKGDLIRFYLTHPQRMLHQVKLTAMHSGMVRPWYMANHGQAYPLMTYSDRMSLWSQARSWLAFDTLWGNLAVAGAFFLLAIRALRRRENGWGALLPLGALAGGLAYAFLLPVMLNGEGDFAKHMFAYVELVDLLFLGCLAMAFDSRNGGAVRLAACVILAAGLVLPSGIPALAAAQDARQSHVRPEAGAYVSFGTYEGEPLVWRVTETAGDELTLWCVRDDIVLPFDEAGGNDWRGSSVRTWLQTEFLAEFTEDQRAMLCAMENTVILSNARRNESLSGDLEFACSHIPALAARGYDRAYAAKVTDRVTLPDVDMVTELIRNGAVLGGVPFWLETPYCPSESLARYVGTDGYIYFGATQVAKSIRPVVTVTVSEPVSGTGSISEPFLFD